MIVIRTMAGLCNRMRVIDSGHALAKKFNVRLHVLWERNADCNCRFRDLFSTADLPYTVTELGPGAVMRLVGRYDRAVFSRFNNRYLPNKRVRRRREEPEWFETLVAKHRHLYFHTVNRFYHHAEGEAFSSFRPTRALQDILDGYSTAVCVGVHIRRTDHRRAIENSPLSLFVEMMNRELVRDPETWFYLATDDPAAEQEVHNLFPGRILVHSRRSLDRNTEAGMHDAMIDLYNLSRCRSLIGSFRSSFSDTAAGLGGIDLQCAQLLPEDEFMRRDRQRRLAAKAERERHQAVKA